VERKKQKKKQIIGGQRDTSAHGKSCSWVYNRTVGWGHVGMVDCLGGKDDEHRSRVKCMGGLQAFFL